MDSQSFLDEMIEEDSVQILKAALPYLPASGQSFVSIFAKVLELQNTIRLFTGAKDRMQLCAQSKEKADPLEMLTACSMQQCLPRRCKRAPGQSYQRHCHDTNV